MTAPGKCRFCKREILVGDMCGPCSELFDRIEATPALAVDMLLAIENPFFIVDSSQTQEEAP